MAVPKRKQSKQRTNTRYANWKISTPNLVACKSCHELKLQHRACPYCGAYNENASVDVSKTVKE